MILGVKRIPLFLHEIEWKNNAFLFTTPNIIDMTETLLIKINKNFAICKANYNKS